MPKSNTIPNAMWLIVLGIFAVPAISAIAAPCPAATTPPVTVTAITPELDLRLADERLLHLAGLEMLSGPAREAAHAELTALLQNRDILVRPLTQKPDRWGRLAVQVFGPVPNPATAELAVPPPYVNEALVAAGLFRIEPGAEPNDCLSNLMHAEADARAAGFGLWVDPANAILDASDTETLTARNGQFSLVQGKVRRVGQGRARTYLDFGTGRGDFSVTVAKRQLKLFARAGMPLAGLTGAFLRVRGHIDTRFGPQIEIFGPDEIEILKGLEEEALTKAVDKGQGR